MLTQDVIIAAKCNTIYARWGREGRGGEGRGGGEEGRGGEGEREGGREEGGEGGREGGEG